MNFYDISRLPSQVYAGDVQATVDFGYDGIKLELPVELATGKSFLELYVDYVLAVQARAREDSGDASLVVPLCIMTSDDTDAPTRARQRGVFGF